MGKKLSIYWMIQEVSDQEILILGINENENQHQ
jgi:hypothetical protein